MACPTCKALRLSPSQSRALHAHESLLFSELHGYDGILAKLYENAPDLRADTLLALADVLIRLEEKHEVTDPRHLTPKILMNVFAWLKDDTLPIANALMGLAAFPDFVEALWISKQLAFDPRPFFPPPAEQDPRFLKLMADHDRRRADKVFRDGDTLLSPNGKRYIIETRVPESKEADGYLVLRPEGRDRKTDAFVYLTFEEFDSQKWTHLPREEVKRMAKSTHNAASPAGKPRPPRRKRGTALTFTATELDDLARVIGAGQVMLRQTYPIVARLKAAMTRMGVSTKGL